MKYFPRFGLHKNSSGTNIIKDNKGYSYGSYIYARIVEGVIYMIRDNYSVTTAKHKNELVRALKLPVVMIDGFAYKGLSRYDITEYTIKEKINILMTLQRKPRIRKTTIEKLSNQILELKQQLIILPKVFNG